MTVAAQIVGVIAAILVIIFALNPPGIRTLLTKGARYADQVGDLAYYAWLCIFPIAGCLVLAFVLNALGEGDEILAIYRREFSIWLIILTLLSMLYCLAGVSLAAASAVWSDSREGKSDSLGAGNLIPFWVMLVAFVSVIPMVFKWHLPLVAIGLIAGITFLALPYVGATWSSGIKELLARIKTFSRSEWRVESWTIGLLGVSMLLAVLFFPVSVPRLFGALAILCVAVGFWSLLLSQLFVAMPRRMRYPSLTLLAVAIVLVFENFNDDRLLRVCQQLDPRPCTHGVLAPTTPLRHPVMLNDQLEAWLPKACPQSSKQARCPMIFVAAAGGGLRAAYWTAGVLGRINDATSGYFYQHLFAISSVSGGSLGAAAFIAVNEGNRPGPQYDFGRTKKLGDFLSRDYLSPIVAALVFPEVMQRFWPAPVQSLDRANAFEGALEDSWTSVYHNEVMSDDFLAMWPSSDAEPTPSLFVNSTNVDSGKRFIVSNVFPSSPGDAYYAYDPKAVYHITKLPLSAAIHLSGRFPYVSPAAVLQSLPSDFGKQKNIQGVAPWGRLVDGGYYEGTGTATLNDVLQEVLKDLNDPKYAQYKVQPFILVLLNDPRPYRVSGLDGTVPSLPSRPVEAPLQYSRDMDSSDPENVQQQTTPWSDYQAPLETYLATQDARSISDRIELYNFAIKAAQGCSKNRLSSAEMAVSALGESLPQPGQVLVRNDCGGYWEISYATIRVASSDPANVDSNSASFAYDEPALGWILSCESQQSMNHAIGEIDHTMKTSHPISTLRSVLNVTERDPGFAPDQCK
jgi:hypothetical protein